MENGILIYFDLRKYAYIEKNKTEQEIISLLSEVHTQIKNIMKEIDAELYKIQTDTAIYLIKKETSANLPQLLKDLKKQIDSFLEKKNLPSRLHICVVKDIFFAGKIKTASSEHFNIFGPIMNKLQKFMYIIETSNDEKINEGIIFCNNAFNKSTQTEYFKEIEIKNERIYLIKM
ncbi:MAG: hypothetical protein JXR63_02730 [Spirochaetales bacterium]|nr:hypothetical protein [Spirochaetales bacterium]